MKVSQQFCNLLSELVVTVLPCCHFVYWRLDGRPLVNGIDDMNRFSKCVNFVMNHLVMYWIEYKRSIS